MYTFIFDMKERVRVAERGEEGKLHLGIKA